MGTISRLSPELANQISAGEVVERPASAVKELVENALDAGAKRVVVTIEFGGKKLIRVEDDGEGMIVEDAALALERHATSKLRRLEDLGEISTLGFRGEALPSIASVSHLTLRTRARGTLHGIELRVDGGRNGLTKQVGMAEGTVIEVSDLFFNVAARRKFLKSDSAESAQVSRTVTQLALGYPEVGFTLKSRGRRLLECPPVGDVKERFFQLYGERTDLVTVGKVASGIKVTGFVAALADQGPTRGPQNIFVNRRIVKDRTLTHAIHEAYSQATVKPRNPEVHLFIELSPTRIDVNVHPMKAEVRFLEQSLMHELLRRALGEALGQQSSVPMPTQTRFGSGAEPLSQSIPGVVSSIEAVSRWSSGVKKVFTVDKAATDDQVLRNQEPEGQPLIPLGQFRDTFILAVDNEGVVIIDQHVAHERVLYEQVLQRLTIGPLEGQRLLEPLLLELPPGHLEVLAVHSANLHQLGFEVEPFGGDSVRVMTIPSLLARPVAERTVRALAADLDGFDEGETVEEVLRRLAATTACHAAVKANDRLTQEKMFHILSELRRTNYSTVCPHGRPVVLRLTRQEIEKSFERI